MKASVNCFCGEQFEITEEKGECPHCEVWYEKKGCYEWSGEPIF